MKKVYLHPDFADCDRIHIDTCAFRAYSSHELEGIHNSFIRGDLISDQFRISKGVSCEMYLQSGLRRGFSRHVSNLRAEREVSDVSLRAITNYFIGHDLVLPDSTRTNHIFRSLKSLNIMTHYLLLILKYCTIVLKLQHMGLMFSLQQKIATLLRVVHKSLRIIDEEKFNLRMNCHFYFHKRVMVSSKDILSKLR